MIDFMKMLANLTGQDQGLDAEVAAANEDPLLAKKRKLDELNRQVAQAPTNVSYGLGDTDESGPMVDGMVDKGYKGKGTEFSRPGAQRAQAFMTEDPNMVAKAPTMGGLRSVASDFPEDKPLLDSVVPAQKEEPKMDLIQQLLKKGTYEDAIKRRDNMLADANIFEGANQIGAALAGTKSQYSGDNLRKRAELETQDYTKGLEDANSRGMLDPNSDISKLAQERATAVLTSINPKSPLIGKLQGMSAQQLKAAFGEKVMGGIESNKKSFKPVMGILGKGGMPLMREENTGKIYIQGKPDLEYDMQKLGVEGQFKKQVKDESGREWTVDPINGHLLPTFPYDEENPPQFIPATGTAPVSANATTPASPKATEVPVKKTGDIAKMEDEDDSAYLNKVFKLKPIMQDKIKDIQGKIASDKQLTDLNEAVSNIDASKALVQANAPGSGPMLARALLSIYETGGRFTDADIQQMKGPTDLKAKMKRFLVENFDSTQAVSDTDQASQMEILKILEQKKTEQLSSKYVPYINQMSKLGLDKDVSSRLVTGDRVSAFSELATPRSLNVTTPGKKETQSTKSSAFPKKLFNKKTGESATVNNEADLKEANDEGFN